jgi:hypothetical protein
MGNTSEASLVAQRVLHGYNSSFLPALVIQSLASAYTATNVVARAVSSCESQRSSCPQLPKPSLSSIETCSDAVDFLVDSLAQLRRDMLHHKGKRARVACFGDEQCLVQMTRNLGLRCGTLYSHASGRLRVAPDFYKPWCAMYERRFVLATQ